MKKEIYKLLDGIDGTASDKIDIHREVSVTEDDKNADEESLFILTKKSNGEKREITLNAENPPYALLCEEDDIPKELFCPVITVKNARDALSRIYSNLYGVDYGKIKIVGITGTNGKSATAIMLHHILNYEGSKCGLISTGKVLSGERVLTDAYYSSTTPDPQLLYKYLKEFITDGCKYAVMEVSSHSIKLSKVSPIPFTLCAFTNLSEEHRDFHPDMEDYYRTKLSLFQNTERGIFNLDDKYSRRAYLDAKCKKHSVGILWEAESYATDIDTHSLTKSSYYYREENLICPVKLNIGGSFNVYNSLVAIKCARILGVAPCVISSALKSLRGADGRMECHSGGGITVVIDYAHTPLAFENLLRFVKRTLKPKQKLTVVFGCGGERDFAKRGEMGKVASLYADKIILTEDNSRGEKTEDVISDVKKGIINSPVEIVPKRASAVRKAILDAETGEVILLVGKGCEGYLIDRGGYHPYSERETALSSLGEREAGLFENKA